jgi:hypothetical protein
MDDALLSTSDNVRGIDQSASDIPDYGGLFRPTMQAEGNRSVFFRSNEVLHVSLVGAPLVRY